MWKILLVIFGNWAQPAVTIDINIVCDRFTLPIHSTESSISKLIRLIIEAWSMWRAFPCLSRTLSDIENNPKQLFVSLEGHERRRRRWKWCGNFLIMRFIYSEEFTLLLSINNKKVFIVFLRHASFVAEIFYSTKNWMLCRAIEAVKFRWQFFDWIYLIQMKRI